MSEDLSPSIGGLGCVHEPYGLDDPGRPCRVCLAVALLPSWFIERMMSDSWCFGLLLVTGQVLAVSNIDWVRQDARGDIWLDLQLFPGDLTLYNWPGQPSAIGVPVSRGRASVAARHIVAAFELSGT